MKNICIHKDNKISFLDIPKHYACVSDGKVIIVDERWITINADEEEGRKGQHVLIKENGDIVFGLGGRFKNLKDLGGQRKDFLFTKDEVEKRIKEERAKIAKEKGIGIARVNTPFAKLLNNSTDFNPVKYHEKQPSEAEIIKELGGADKTKGSCASLALAYTAQKGGLNVLDFRDGYSREFFVDSDNKAKLFEKAIVETDERNLHGTYYVLTKVISEPAGKEFLLATGNHMAVIRRIEYSDGSSSFHYLELQSDRPKWETMGSYASDTMKKTLKNRFNTRITRTERSKTQKCYLYDCDKLREDENFKMALGFINTDKDKQKKGSGGGIK